MGERRRYLIGGLVGVVATGLVVVSLWWLWCSTTTLLVVRHADRVSGQDLLTDAGEVRAQALAHVVARAGLAAIYTSDANRTRQTAAPAAAALGLSPVEFPGGDVAELVADVFANHRGGTVLVVGHSNTVPMIIEEAGGPALPDIDGTEYDHLYSVSVCRCPWRNVTVVNLQYGAVSP